MPQKAVIMENAPIGSFVAELGAINAQRFSIVPSMAPARVNNLLADNISTQKVENLVKALSISRPTGTIRTFAPLSRLYGNGYWVTVIAHGSQNMTKVELEIDVVATSKCMPKFNSDQELIFYIPVNIFYIVCQVIIK